MFKTTRDGYIMHPQVWQLPDGDCGERWTWGWVPANGSKYSAVNKGIWSSKDEATDAMNCTLDELCMLQAECEVNNAANE